MATDFERVEREFASGSSSSSTCVSRSYPDLAAIAGKHTKNQTDLLCRVSEESRSDKMDSPGACRANT
jgi:hypothetical protein